MGDNSETKNGADQIDPNIWWGIDDDLTVYSIYGDGDGDKGGSYIYFSFRGKLIHVSVFPPSLEKSDGSHSEGKQQIEAHAFDLFWEILDEESEEHYTDIEDKILLIILEAGKPLLKRLPAEELSDKQCLHSQLFREILMYRLIEGSDDKPCLIPISAGEAYRAPEAYAEIREDEDIRRAIVDTIPQYSSRDIRLSTFFTQGANSVEDNIHINGQEMHCKASGESLWPESGLGREIRVLSPIQRIFKQGGQGLSIQIPLLLGYIKHAETGRIVGTLTKPISGRILQWIGIADTDIETKRKWASQIRELVRELHASGVTWGSARPSNLVVDKNDDVWLYDFQGGCDQRWMDMELYNTIKGDDQAVGRIIEFLDIGEAPAPLAEAVDGLQRVREAHI
ncbi:hypothetical protein PT974_05842 [Cladobotryum mycophilum]|uniref:Protein kinase domain-containing protein n=1 Tax=Cladobotryum mycophilum TaxID=491253 RepID=A0ABR0SJW7_9HYPO